METDLIWMSLCIGLPSVFALSLLAFPKGSEEMMRWWSLVGTAATFVISTFVFVDYQRMLYVQTDEGNLKAGMLRPSAKTSLGGRALATIQREADPNFGGPSNEDGLARVEWIKRFNIDYYVGVDGISMPLILLTTVLFFLSMIASWGIEKHVKGYCMLFLILETGVLGTFLALDFFLFYIFWEVMLLPMYFLIGIWGGPRREYAAIKFFLYTLFGSVFILIAILGFYFTDVQDFVDRQTILERIASVSDNARLPGPARISTPKQGLPGQGKAPGIPQVPLAPAEVKVNTFDIIVLTNVGMEAMRWQKVQSTPKERREFIQSIVDRRNAKVKDKDGVEVSSGIETTYHDVEQRMGQAFFGKTFQWVMFLFLFVGFAIKIPAFPFHTWLPDAHVEAPTPISMILAGILLKLGGYGIIRIAYPICPFAAQTLALWLCSLAMVNIVYGAFAAMAQTDFKKLVAYSSISHMGYVMLGIAVWPQLRAEDWIWGMNGAMYQMIAHGISSAGMFFLVGVIYDRAHHRNLDNFRGLNEPMPLYGGISAVIFFAALGLPGLCGFVGEFMVILSTWNFSTAGAPHAGKVFAVLAALTVVITAAYILWTIQRVFLGTNPAYKDYKDMTAREIACIAPLVVLAVLLGVLPMIILSWMEPHVTNLVDSLFQVKL